jgi:hypothetical protein
MPGIPAATITTPVNDTRVENSEFVKGTAHNIEGAQYYLWLVLYDYNANRHYPQDGPVVVSSDGQWEMTTFFESIGRYDITAVAADQNANEILLQYQAASQSVAWSSPRMHNAGFSHSLQKGGQRMPIIALLDTPNAVQSQKVLALISIGKLSDGLYLLLPS